MVEVFRTTDIVKVSYIQHLLAEAGIEAFVADQHIAAVEGSIGAFPRRILVSQSDEARARKALKDVEPG